MLGALIKNIDRSIFVIKVFENPNCLGCGASYEPRCTFKVIFILTKILQNCYFCFHLNGCTYYVLPPMFKLKVSYYIGYYLYCVLAQACLHNDDNEMMIWTEAGLVER